MLKYQQYLFTANDRLFAEICEFEAIILEYQFQMHKKSSQSRSKRFLRPDKY
jgi:hypothetical protein